MKDRIDKVISLLPYTDPFLFVDEISELTENNIKGSYTIKEDEYFFKGHFKEKPIVPGVIITEIMAQIGLVSFGISLIMDKVKEQDPDHPILPVFSNYQMEFVSAVEPGTKLTVEAKKKFFRLGKLFCSVICTNGEQVVARGELGGMLIRMKS